MNKTIYGNKLAHYATRQPKSFLQMDIFYTPHPVDDERRPDADGDAYSAHGTVELMHGASVRVLIPRGTDARIASRQLKKLAKWFEREPDELLKLAWQIPENEQPSIEDDIPF